VALLAAFSPRSRTAAVFTLSALLLSASFAQGEDPGLEVLAPWALSRRVNPRANELEFLAMTPALDDHNAWLLLACTPARGEVQVYLIAASTFTSPLPRQARLELRIDDLPAIPSLGDTAEGRLIRLRTPAPRDLAAQIDRGRRIRISIQQLNRVQFESCSL